MLRLPKNGGRHNVPLISQRPKAARGTGMEHEKRIGEGKKENAAAAQENTVLI